MESSRLDFEAHARPFYKQLVQLDRAATAQLDAAGVDARLRELLRIRASQLNGCAYCIDMHTRDARAVGETEQRIYALSAWRETPFFSGPERSALALVEAVTTMSSTGVPLAVFEEAARHFDEAGLGSLISLAVMINAWNAVGVSTRAWEPGSYEP